MTSEPEGAMDSTVGKKPLNKEAAKAAGLDGLGAVAALGLLGFVQVFESRIFSPRRDEDLAATLAGIGLLVALFVLALFFGSLMLGLPALSSRAVRSGSERGRGFAVVGMVLGLLSVLLACSLGLGLLGGG